jgi:hypothetical protein
MAKVLNFHDIFYFRIPLDNIPFDVLPIVINERYAYCRFYHVSSVLGTASMFRMVGVYDFLSEQPIDDITQFKEREFLFGEVSSFDPPLRGPGKWILLAKEPVLPGVIELPHLSFGSSSCAFYLKDGKYDSGYGIETDYENVKHLEDNYFYSEDTIQLRIILETVRIRAKAIQMEISQQEWEDMAFKVLRAGRFYKKMNDSDIAYNAKSTVKEVLARPIYAEVPKKWRQRAIIE